MFSQIKTETFNIKLLEFHHICTFSHTHTHTHTHTHIYIYMCVCVCVHIYTYIYIYIYISHFWTAIIASPTCRDIFRKLYIYLLVLVVVSAFTLVGWNRLPPEQVQHLESSHPTFADPGPGHTKWRANRDFIAEDQLLWDLIVLLGQP